DLRRAPFLPLHSWRTDTPYTGVDSSVYFDGHGQLVHQEGEVLAFYGDLTLPRFPTTPKALVHREDVVFDNTENPVRKMKRTYPIPGPSHINLLRVRRPGGTARVSLHQFPSYRNRDKSTPLILQQHVIYGRDVHW